MTTIVYRDGIMAADCLVTSGDGRFGTRNKVFKVHRTSHETLLFGCTGTIGEAQRMVDLIMSRKHDVIHQEVLPEGTFNCLLVRETRVPGVHTSRDMFCYDGHGKFYPLNGPFAAIGTGEDYALGAMAMGAKAGEALAVAIAFDTKSGPPTNAVQFDLPESVHEDEEPPAPPVHAQKPKLTASDLNDIMAGIDLLRSSLSHLSDEEREELRSGIARMQHALARQSGE